MSAGIIIPARGQALLLRRALDSVLEQDYQDWQLVIAARRNLKEETELVAEACGERLRKRCRTVYFPPSAGRAEVLNQALAALETRYAVIHEEDDTWDPAFLQEATQYLDQAPPRTGGAVALASQVVERVEDGEIKTLSESSYNGDLRQISLFAMLSQNLFPATSFVFTKEAWEKTGRFRPAPSHLVDWDFNIRFLFQFEIGLIHKELARRHFQEETLETMRGTVAEDRKPFFSENLTRNQWLREELQKGNINWGVLAGLSHANRMIEEHADGLSRQMETKLAEIEKQLESISYFIRNMGPRLPKIESRLRALDFLISNLQPRFNFLENKLSHLEYLLSKMEKNVLKKSPWKWF